MSRLASDVSRADRGLPVGGRDDASLDRIREALRALRFGTVTITVHDGAVVQVDRTERIRLDR
jgi:hypothetical protein